MFFSQAYFSNSLSFFYWYLRLSQGFPGDSDSKDSACSAGDPGSISRSGRSPKEGHGNPLQSVLAANTSTLFSLSSSFIFILSLTCFLYYGFPQAFQNFCKITVILYNMLSKKLVRHTHMLCESRRSVSLSQWRSPARPSRSCLGACQSRAQKTENARGLLLNLSPSVSSQLSPRNKLRQRRQWLPTPVLSPGKSHGRRSLVGCGPWGL